jgi:hypothetical protein
MYFKPLRRSINQRKARLREKGKCGGRRQLRDSWSIKQPTNDRFAQLTNKLA